jgi:hypothetical protein
MECERMLSLGGFQYAISKSYVVQECKKKLEFLKAKYLGETITKTFSSVNFMLNVVSYSLELSI